MSYIGQKPLDTYSSLAVQHFTTSATASYTLDQSVTSENDIRLIINGVVQQPGSSYAYTCSGTSLTLSSAITSSDTMHCVFIGKSIGTINPPTGSVGASQLTTNAVGNSAMADDAVGIAELSATGTPSSSNFLRGDNSWQEAGVSGLTNNSNTTWMTVSADEEITTPLQPCFQAYLSATQSNVTGDATSYAITGAIWTEVKDTGGFSNGTFTAPVAGTYLFHGQVLFGGMGSGFTLHSMWISTSNRPYRGWHESDTANTSAEQGRSFCVVADMDASDIAYLTVKVSGSSKTVDVFGTSSAQTTNFSGFLLG